MDRVSNVDFERLTRSQEELSAHVVALTAVVGAIATAASIDFELLEDCIQFATRRLAVRHRPILREQASSILSEFEAMQKGLRVKVRKMQSQRKRASKARR
jgi:hypothetical protein